MNTSSLVTADDWLKAATKRLKESNIESARLDSLILLEDQLKINRPKLLSESRFISLKNSDISNLEMKISRRELHEPLAYIRELVNFYGYEFKINKDTLVPRPESELFIESLKALPIYPGDLIADVGSGSGAIGISVKLNFPNTIVDLIELSKKANVIAESNADNLGVSVNILNSDLLSSSSTQYRVILANLPYVPDDMKINRAARFEPRMALFGGADGLDLYRKLILQITERVHKPEYLLLEALETQHVKLIELLDNSGYKLLFSKGLILTFTKK